MEHETNDAFDMWYAKLCQLLHEKGKIAPYKAAYFEFFERGLTPEDVVEDGDNLPY